MYLCSGLHGQAHVRLARLERRADRVQAGHEVAVRPARRAPRWPMRVMIRMLTTTYGESDSSTPMCAIGEPSGPMLNGTTYIVRPRMQPSNSAVERGLHLVGVHPVVGRAGVVLLRLQMKVRSSTRATSPGSDARQEAVGPLGRVEPDERAAGDHLRAQPVVLLLASRRTSGPAPACTARPSRPPSAPALCSERMRVRRSVKECLRGSRVANSWYAPLLATTCPPCGVT